MLALLRRRGLVLAAVLIGMAFALYLTQIEAHVLGVWCLYCVISQGIIAAHNAARHWVGGVACDARQGLRREASGFQLARLQLIHVAPHPALSGLDRADQRMSDVVEVFGGVLVLRRIAAAYVAADQAQAQMDPSCRPSLRTPGKRVWWSS